MRILIILTAFTYFLSSTFLMASLADIFLDGMVDLVDYSVFSSAWLSNVIPFIYIMRASKAKKRLQILSLLLNIIFNQNNKGLIILGVGSYWQALFQDQQKLKRCASRHLTSHGPLCPCVYNLRDDSLSYTRLAEEKAGIL